MGFLLSVNKIKLLRLVLEMSQSQLSRETGIHQVRLSRIEAGSLDPTDSEERSIAAALKVEPSQLFAKKEMTGA